MGLFETSVSFVARSERRKQILFLLNEISLSQPEIMKKTKMYKSHTSRTLSELLDKKLIVCKNPEDREFKFYKITPLGRKTLEYLKRF
jgi:predicted transcriptional regulator